jgi:hypothetical protein
MTSKKSSCSIYNNFYKGSFLICFRLDALSRLLVLTHTLGSRRSRFFSSFICLSCFCHKSKEWDYENKG